MTWTQTSATQTTTWVESTGTNQIWSEVVTPPSPNWLEIEASLTYFFNFDDVNLLWDGSNSTSNDNLVWNLFQYAGSTS